MAIQDHCIHDRMLTTNYSLKALYIFLHELLNNEYLFYIGSINILGQILEIQIKDT